MESTTPSKMEVPNPVVHETVKDISAPQDEQTNIKPEPKVVDRAGDVSNSKDIRKCTYVALMEDGWTRRERATVRANANEIRIRTEGKLKDYLKYGLKAFLTHDDVTVRATGRPIQTAIIVAERLKMRMEGLVQTTKTDFVLLEDVFTKGEESKTFQKRVPLLEITLTKTEHSRLRPLTPRPASAEGTNDVTRTTATTQNSGTTESKPDGETLPRTDATGEVGTNKSTTPTATDTPQEDVLLSGSTSGLASPVLSTTNGDSLGEETSH